MGAELFHAELRTDGQTETTKLKVDLRDFANAPIKTSPCNLLHVGVSVVC